jgi:hypothetical protein
MDFRQLFNRQPRVFDPTLSTDAVASEPTFLTVQSLVTFSGANVAVSLIRAVIHSTAPEASKSHLVGLAVALTVAFFIWIIGVTDPDTKMDRRAKSIGLALAILNGFTLYLASEGLLGTVGLGGSPTTPG